LRVRVKTAVPESEPTVDSLVPLYGSALSWSANATTCTASCFRGNRDLRPILLYEGFVGHPLRKDYAKLHEQPLVPYRTERAQMTRFA
jgi:NADH-quinone oxidoreductase subunit C